MASFVARRFAVALLLVWGVVTVTFVLIHAAPGDPADLYMTKEMDPATRSAILEAYGLDRPLPQQYWRYLLGLARGELGWSISHQRPVARLLVESIPPTLQLALPAFILQLAVCLAAGSLSAWRRGSWSDAIFSGGSLILRSMPLFVLGALLMLLFTVNLRWLPASGARDLIVPPSAMWGSLCDRARHLALPVVCLGIGTAGYSARDVRAGLLTTFSGIRGLASRARGAGEGVILLRHAMRNILPRLITLAGMNVPILLGGALLVESVFSWPGVGSLIVQAVLARDYTVVIAAHLALAIAVISASLLSDVCRLMIDPRLRRRLGRR